MTRRSSGRAVSATIATRLREALDQPRTYEELARLAGCTTRSVRNYIDQAEATLGVVVERGRGADGRVRARAKGADAGATIEELGHVLAREMLRRIFPIAGTSLERVTRRSPAHVIVGVRGAYEYEESHLRILRTWLSASSRRPRQALRFEYEGIGRGERVVWPLGIVLRDLARVYLLGIPVEAESSRDVRTYVLERAGKPTVLSAQDSGEPLPGLDSAPVERAMDLPFSVSSPAGGVHVHVRFPPEQAKFIRGRRWHRTQKLKSGKDGSLDLRFGPADLGETLGWLGQWSDAVQVLGDRRLLAALRSNGCDAGQAGGAGPRDSAPACRAPRSQARRPSRSLARAR